MPIGTYYIVLGMRLNRKPRHAGPMLVVPVPVATAPLGLGSPPVPEDGPPTTGKEDDGSLAPTGEEEVIPVEMAEEAAAHKAPASEWWLARAAGASVEQAAALAVWGPSALLAGALAAMSAADKGSPLASFEEVAEAASLVAPYAYLVARYAGLGHEEALVAARADITAVEAAISRFSKEEVIEALISGLLPEDYATLRHVASHAEALEAGSLGIASSEYVLAAGAGATHAEITELVRSGSDLWGYARRRSLGLNARSGQPA